MPRLNYNEPDLGYAPQVPAPLSVSAQRPNFLNDDMKGQQLPGFVFSGLPADIYFNEPIRTTTARPASLMPRPAARAKDIFPIKSYDNIGGAGTWSGKVATGNQRNEYYGLAQGLTLAKTDTPLQVLPNWYYADILVPQPSD